MRNFRIFLVCTSVVMLVAVAGCQRPSPRGYGPSPYSARPTYAPSNGQAPYAGQASPSPSGSSMGSGTRSSVPSAGSGSRSTPSYQGSGTR